jgi:Mg-chelatase subunit ChlD
VQLAQLPVTIFGTFSNISVREGKTQRVVQSIAKADETPLTVGLLLDASDSMEQTLPDLQEAAIRFLDTVLGPRDRAFVISFDTRAHLLQPPTSDKALLRAAIMHIRPDGLTSLYDAMALGLLQFEGIKGRRAMIVFTDGFDMTSEYEAPEVGELARREGVPVHAIGSAGEELKRVAKMTGGTSQPLDDLAQLPAIFARIEAALRAQVLVFVRTDPAKRENEWRSVNVEVEGKDLEVHAPAGYYATW